jgi:translation initiation factor 2D
MKNSSYKKIGKFFQSLSKLGVIEYKEAKKGSNPMITKINMNHPKVKDWTPTINKMGSNSKND